MPFNHFGCTSYYQLDKKIYLQQYLDQYLLYIQ